MFVEVALSGQMKMKNNIDIDSFNSDACPGRKKLMGAEAGPSCRGRIQEYFSFREL